ncbi:MAG: SDR family oxidoreductase [Betaproteobacteria bacterium]|jgi:short-subunit dehydrogenase|nr:SDR family oxidoreductase [Betaproteobacteria bacterium]
MRGGRQAVLTGATGGIGAAIAAALAPRCATLVLVARDRGRLDSLAATLAQHGPALRVVVVAADLSTATGRAAVAGAARALPGGIDLLVNNAGIGDFAWFEAEAEADIERVIVTNLLAPVLLTRTLLPLMHRGAPRGGSSVINVGSILGDIGNPGNVAYSTSKYGLRGFSEALRRELHGSGVQVQYLAPRATRTPLNSAAQDALNAELGTGNDNPQVVAQALLDLVDGGRAEMHLGWPERFFVRLNRLLPSVVDRALGRRATVVRRHASMNEGER